MFGYIVMNKPEIKMKDFDMYRTFYCGLCRELREKYGISGQKIRDEIKFPSFEALKAQIEQDVKTAKAFFAK